MNPLLGALASVPAGARALAVGYSGGLDSSALLHAVRAHLAADYPVRALHVCHHLRPAAPDWAEHCAARCQTWGIACTRLDVDVVERGQGPESAARAARYAAIAAELDAGEWLVTAHHAEDQAETFMLQALRGAGVRGLAAMPERAPFGRAGHWRPWLTIERAAIRAYALDQRLDWIEDPSNHDPGLDRSYLRRHVWPVIAQRWPAAPRTLARSAAHAADAARCLDDYAAHHLPAARGPKDSLTAARLARLPVSEQRLLLRTWLERAGLDVPGHRHVEQIITLVHSRLAASPCVAFGATQVRLFDGRLFCMRALAPPPRVKLRWRPPAALVLPADCGTLTLDAARLDNRAPAELAVCFRAGGERLPDDRGGARALKKFLREQRVAPWIRERLPLVYRGDTLLAVADLWCHPQIEGILACKNVSIGWTHALPGPAGHDH